MVDESIFMKIYPKFVLSICKLQRIQKYNNKFLRSKYIQRNYNFAYDALGLIYYAWKKTVQLILLMIFCLKIRLKVK